MRQRRTFLRGLGAVGTVGLLAGCGGDGGDGDSGTSDGSDGSDGDGGSDGSGGDGDTDTPTPEPSVTFGGDGEINFNLSPSVPQEDLNVQYSPLRDHIQDYVTANYDTPEGLEARMNIGSNYSAVIQALGQGTADLAETGPFAASVGVTTENLEVILQRFGYGSWTYKSIIATRNGSDISELADLEGERVAFSDPLSTSGFLFPAAAMKEAGVDIGNLPEGNGSQAAFDPVFAGGHVQSYTLLEQEQVAAAGMGGFVRDTKAGPTPEGFESVATTLHEDEGLPRAPIVVSTELPDESKEALKQAFLDAPEDIYLGADGEDGTDDDLWFGDVREATVDDYQSVIETAESLGVGPDFFEE
ncbi:MAG: phosphate/phosphite/phosphonate ABC transporter substrate-binding protein [Halobacteriales archaeon SW_9_67_25]|nr:MAG: phosphate/phosphite/phosphonate ABC transporter substrate-binding protein [Halobacteriales archaeon SW_9_67_25]